MSASKHSDIQIIEGVLTEFAELAKIPRPSGHEKVVSDYLKKRFEELGMTTIQDEVLNVIADMPATKGMEGVPRTILQCHMDMVCVAAEGTAYDPLNDPIHLYRTEDELSAVGTSLGADDGMGIAAVIYMLDALKEQSHGAVRMICTVDEERGMTGAMRLDARHLEDASYLINVDSENYDELTVGCAGSVNIDFKKRIERTEAIRKGAWILRVAGLRGGHSGERIGDNRANAAKALACFLANVEASDFPVELASFTAGKARNAIPASGEAIFVTDASETALHAILSDTERALHNVFGATDPDLRLSIERTEMPATVTTSLDTQMFLRLVRILHSGVYAMSIHNPLQVETSANLGIACLDEEFAALYFFPRSSNDAKLRGFIQEAKDIAELTGYQLTVGNVSPGWEEKPESVLRDVMTDVFQQQNGRAMKVQSIHAGLECGYYARMCPALDIVSIGVTTRDIHSPKERVILASIPPIVRLIEETLVRIGQEKHCRHRMVRCVSIIRSI